MPRYNLYIPSNWEREAWEKWAAKDGRPLASFIRQAVWDRITYMQLKAKQEKK